MGSQCRRQLHCNLRTNAILPEKSLGNFQVLLRRLPNRIQRRLHNRRNLVPKVQKIEKGMQEMVTQQPQTLVNNCESSGLWIYAHHRRYRELKWHHSAQQPSFKIRTHSCTMSRCHTSNSDEHQTNRRRVGHWLFEPCSTTLTGCIGIPSHELRHTWTNSKGILHRRSRSIWRQVSANGNNVIFKGSIRITRRNL